LKLVLLACMILSSHQAGVQSYSQTRLLPVPGKRSYTVEQLEFLFRTGMDPKALRSEVDRLDKGNVNPDAKRELLYLRARSYHEQFELSLESGSAADSNSALSAIKAYKKYISLYEPKSASGHDPLISDVRFYKAMAYLEINRFKDALVVIRDWKPQYDDTVDIDDLYWSKAREFSVKQQFASAGLRSELNTILARKTRGSSPDLFARSVAAELKNWLDDFS
jgi:hypothetical protein